MRGKLKTKDLKLKTLERGIASLGAMLLLGGFIVEIGLIGVLLVTLLTSSNIGIRFSAEALGGAHGGVQEAMLGILRDRDGPLGGLPYNISFSAGSVSVNVEVCPNVTGGTVPGTCGSTVAPGKYEIHSLASSFGHERWLVAVVEVDPATGLLRVQSIEEKTR